VVRETIREYTRTLRKIAQRRKPAKGGGVNR
jgi:hypothetical protein